mmetsp:Transcript_53515/g.160136  ORF Transcript_53515/g.160136 Transcript_53515/m.160136 type:complete len:217 (-) Transcript_53515:124-774(-)
MLVAGTCSLVLPSMKEVMHLILTQLLKTHGGKRNTKATQPRLSQGLRKITASRKDKRSTSQYRKEQAEKITRKKVVSNLMTMSRMTMFRAKHHQDPQLVGGKGVGSQPPLLLLVGSLLRHRKTRPAEGDRFRSLRTTVAMFMVTQIRSLGMTTFSHRRLVVTILSKNHRTTPFSSKNSMIETSVLMVKSYDRVCIDKFNMCHLSNVAVISPCTVWV